MKIHRPKISKEELEKRRPSIPPWILMDARHEVVHKELGIRRAAKVVKRKP